MWSARPASRSTVVVMRRRARCAALAVVVALAVGLAQGEAAVAAPRASLTTAERSASTLRPSGWLGSSCVLASSDDRRTFTEGSWSLRIKCAHSGAASSLTSLLTGPFPKAVGPLHFQEYTGACAINERCGDSATYRTACTVNVTRQDDGSVPDFFSITMTNPGSCGSSGGGGNPDLDRLTISGSSQWFAGLTGYGFCSYGTVANASPTFPGACEQASWAAFDNITPQYHWTAPVELHPNMCESITAEYFVNDVELVTLNGATANATDRFKVVLTVDGWSGGEPKDVRLMGEFETLAGLPVMPRWIIDLIGLDEDDVVTRTYTAPSGGLDLSSFRLGCWSEVNGVQEGPIELAQALGTINPCEGMSWVWPTDEQLIAGREYSARFRWARAPANWVSGLYLDVEGSDGLYNFDSGDSGTYEQHLTDVDYPDGTAVSTWTGSFPPSASGWFTVRWTQAVDGLTSRHGVWCDQGAFGDVLYQFDATYVGSDSEGEEACFSFESMSLTSPSSWLRGLGRMSTCLLKWTFVPDSAELAVKFDEFQDELFGQFPFSIVATAADFLSTLGTEIETASGTGCFTGTTSLSFGEYGEVDAEAVCIGDDMTISSGERSLLVVMFIAPMVWALLRYTWSTLFGSRVAAETA